MANIMPGVEMDGSPEAAFRIARLKQSFEAFGVLVDFLSRLEPFSRYDLGNFARALQLQISRGCHLAAFSGTKLIGYCGWLPTTSAIASAWVDDKGPLTPVAEGADAVVLTVVAAGDRRVLASLIRQARELNPGRRVFFKRQYADRVRPARKSSVENVTRGGPSR